MTSKPQIEIVSHCWAGRLPQYATFLRFQLSSLALYPPGVPYIASVCYSSLDGRTSDVVRWFRENTDLPLNEIVLEPENLFRRAIGRNLAAKQTTADLIWFTDVDHIFRENCLSNAMQQWNCRPRYPESTPTSPILMYPRTIWIHKEHSLGDAAIEQADTKPDQLLDIDPSEYVLKRYRQAYGGVQLVDGDDARTYGYLNGRRWRKRTSFGQCNCDVVWRRRAARRGKFYPIPTIEGLYRMRHSTAGRSKPKEDER